jgi:hypothetical protein
MRAPPARVAVTSWAEMAWVWVRRHAEALRRHEFGISLLCHNADAAAATRRARRRAWVRVATALRAVVHSSPASGLAVVVTEEARAMACSAPPWRAKCGTRLTELSASKTFSII